MTGVIIVVAVAAVSVAPFGRYSDGMLSKTTPSGWIADWLNRQREGLTGHPEAMSYPYDTCLWAGEIPTLDAEQGGNWWRYEQSAYYTDGLIRLGYALHDPSFVEKAVAGVENTLKNQTPEGELGHPSLWDASRFEMSTGYEMWPQAVFFRVFKAKYEAEPDERIPRALLRYYFVHEPAFIAKERNMVNIEGMLWTYSLTKDSRLLELAEEVWAGAHSTQSWSGALTPKNCLSDEPIYMHGVSYCEMAKLPLLLYAHTGKTAYLDQATNVEHRLERHHLLADGCISSTEQTRGNSVHWGHETCDIVDFTWTLGYFLEITGAAQYADLIERCVFNAGLGSVDKDFRSLQYFSNLNQFISTSRSNHNPHHYGSTWSQYRSIHQTECCVGNIHRLLPNYVSRMWLKDREGWPVAALYGPCEADFGWARIREETDYPASGRVRFVFRMSGIRAAKFTYRVPGWCVSRKDAGSFVTVEREFHDGDVLELDFPMEPIVRANPPRRVYGREYDVDTVFEYQDRPGSNQGVCVERGPLLFAYPIPVRREVDSVQHANLLSKRCGNPKFKSWNLKPDGPFNYTLAADRFETVTDEGGEIFSATRPCVSLLAKVRRIRWDLVDERFTPDLPAHVESLSDGTETIRLVPFGATTLRLTVFPK